MDQNQYVVLSSGQLSSGIDKNDTLVIKTIEFVKSQLATWRDDKDRPDEQAEDRLNLQLCKFLDSQARNDFPMVRFNHEEYQAGHRSVDLSATVVNSTLIGVKHYSIYDSFLVIECKRLPAPNKEREKEYITGGEKTSGGIQRFKLELHGSGMDTMVMIGYIQKHSSPYWFKKINEWISELVNGLNLDSCPWKSSELLNLIDINLSNGVSSHISSHNRVGTKSNNLIEIYHLWVLMNREGEKNK